MQRSYFVQVTWPSPDAGTRVINFYPFIGVSLSQLRRRGTQAGKIQGGLIAYLLTWVFEGVSNWPAETYQAKNLVCMLAAHSGCVPLAQLHSFPLFLLPVGSQGPALYGDHSITGSTLCSRMLFLFYQCSHSLLLLCWLVAAYTLTLHPLLLLFFWETNPVGSSEAPGRDDRILGGTRHFSSNSSALGHISQQSQRAPPLQL